MPICPNCQTEYEEVCPNCGQAEEPPPFIHKSPYVRATVKVLMVVGFLVLVALVVFGTDALIEWIRGLF